MKIPQDEAETLATRLLEEHRAATANARPQASVLVDAELKGHPSHGLQRPPRPQTVSSEALSTSIVGARAVLSTSRSEIGTLSTSASRLPTPLISLEGHCK